MNYSGNPRVCQQEIQVQYVLSNAHKSQDMIQNMMVFWRRKIGWYRMFPQIYFIGKMGVSCFIFFGVHALAAFIHITHLGNFS